MSLSIGEIAEKTGLSARAIRLYEEKKLLPRVERDESGRRIYHVNHVDKLLVISRFRQMGFSLPMIQILNSETVDPLKLIEERLDEIKNEKKQLEEQSQLVQETIKRLKSREPLDSEQKSLVLRLFTKNPFEKLILCSAEEYRSAEARLVKFLEKRNTDEVNEKRSESGDHVYDSEDSIYFYQRRELYGSDQEREFYAFAKRHYEAHPESRVDIGNQYLRIRVEGKMGLVIGHRYMQWIGPHNAEDDVDYLRFTEVYIDTSEGWKLLHIHRSVEAWHHLSIAKKQDSDQFTMDYEDLREYSEGLDE